MSRRVDRKAVSNIVWIVLFTVAASILVVAVLTIANPKIELLGGHVGSSVENSFKKIP